MDRPFYVGRKRERERERVREREGMQFGPHVTSCPEEKSGAIKEGLESYSGLSDW
jgi:hypothetical protein